MGHVTDKSDGGTNEDKEHNIQTGKQTKKDKRTCLFPCLLG